MSSDRLLMKGRELVALKDAQHHPKGSKSDRREVQRILQVLDPACGPIIMVETGATRDVERCRPSKRYSSGLPSQR